MQCESSVRKKISRSSCVCVPNFVEIAQTAAEIWQFFDFLRWPPSAILDWFYACWDHPRRVLGGLCDCAKFGCNRCSNFDSMQILIFCTLSLKMLIHAPKISCSLTLLTAPNVKNLKFPKSEMATAAILKNRKLTYLFRGLSDFYKNWHSDAVRPS